MSEFDLDKIIQNVSNIKLPGGVVGKTCMVLIVLAISMAAIAWSVKIVWVSCLALILLFVICFVMLWRIISFADRNPKAALLEGAEFLMHEQLLKLGTKDSPELPPVDPKDIIEFRPVKGSKDNQDIQRPDLPSSNSAPENSSGGNK